MGLRFVMRWFALGAPFTWFGFATRFEANKEVVGAEFFREFAARVDAAFQGHGTDTGLMDSLDSLSSYRFDPSKVNETIREFYEHTSRFDLDIKIKWNPIVRPFGILYLNLIAKRMQQLTIPLDNEALSRLDSWLELIDLDKDTKVDYRCWIRIDSVSRVPVYVGAYKTYQSTVDEYLASYISVAFPLPGGNLTTVLTPQNMEGGCLRLTTRDRFSSEAGVYIVFPHKKSFTLMPAFGLSEQFQLKPMPEGQGIEVIHDCFWGFLRAFQMHYKITPIRPRNIHRQIPEYS